MKGKQKDILFSSNQKKPSKSENDSFELYVEDNPDDDYQPVSGSQKRPKGKGKATDSEVTTTSSTSISITDELTVFNKITLEGYDLEYSSDDFDTPAIKRSFLGKSTKSVSRITKSNSAAVESSITASKASLTFPKPSKSVPTAFKSAATSIKTSFCPMPVDEASDVKEGPKKISKRAMTIKTTVKNIWKPVYLQPLYDLVHTTNLLVTHTFAFTERLISKYKEAYFEDAGYTPPNLPYAQQIALYECTKIQTAYYNNIKAHFGNRLRSLINKLFKKKEKAESLRGEMQANKSSSKVIKETIRKKIYRPCNQVKLAISKKEMPEAGLLDDRSRTQLNDFLSSYPEDYTFQKNSIYYDIMASPKNHFKAFFRLAELSEAEQMKQVARFPIRTTFIPCYMTEQV
ncbi:hypothetical protein G6F46_010207 [Rhizopus delemar]|uniref:Uncharacterized protein n=1 Tax=Rhizopus oryzae TaxID=64495 RepID=A0A9P7C6L0_RHIOR|nr:hypothetical protein G6F51_010218 [Rhizopus arrhizus]KAG1610188.1 hypothetical protein G6F46_010207 [Rhizopus delemar]